MRTQPTITHNGMLAAMGRIGAIRENGMVIYVQVLDAKSAWGSVRLLVTPTAGEGEAWVDASRVVLRGFDTPPVMESASQLNAAERAWARNSERSRS